jgi:hypothetical protein
MKGSQVARIGSQHFPLAKAFLCPCGLVGDSAMQCACGNALGLLSLSRVLDRETESEYQVERTLYAIERETAPRLKEI